MKELIFAIFCVLVIAHFYDLHAPGFRDSAKEAFMTGCKQDMKEYEFILLWRNK